MKGLNSAGFSIGVVWIVFGVFGYPVGCLGLRDVRVTVPAAIQLGEKALFICHYDLEGDALYSVKWYKGNREFYRFTPKEIPAIKIFPLTGLRVDKERSNGSHLTLGPVEMSVAGRYSCEVTADAPSYHTALISGETNIVEVPKYTPTISGIKPKYRLGDILRGNCTSRDSKPAANLTWYINGESANPSYVKHLRKVHVAHNLETSQLSLRFVVNKQHFENGRLKIRCTASIYNVYWKSTEKSVDEERPRLTINNAVTPNTLGVNQLPSPYDFYPGGSFFDDDFADHHPNSVTHTKPKDHSGVSPTSKSISALLVGPFTARLIACCILRILSPLLTLV